MKKQRYQTLLEENRLQLQTLQKNDNRLSTLRLLAFLGAAACFWWGLSQRVIWVTLAGFVLLLVFFYLVYSHSRVRRQRELAKNRGQVLEGYLARFGEEWKQFAETGKEFLEQDAFCAQDLDLLGETSLFQFLCVANTGRGKRLLADWLCEAEPQPEQLLRRQQAVKELCGKREFSLHFQTLSRGLRGKEQARAEQGIQRFIAYGEQALSSTPRWGEALCLLLPAVTLASLLLAALGALSPYVGAACAALQFIISMGGYRRNTGLLAPLFSFSRSLEHFAALFEAIQRENFTSPLLRDLQKELNRSGGVTKGIRSLNAIGEAVHIRHNPILYFLLSSLLLWDFHCVLALERWKKSYGGQVRGWFATVSELEALLSLAVLGDVREEVCFPDLRREETPLVQAERLSHPLIPEKQAVANDISLKAQTCVITGSNMSGKTTFLRSIGVNLALCYAGAPVCARRFTASCMRVMTSMRVQDDVSRGISTFYAELLRIKGMVEFSRSGRPLLVLIDEIFKGTNSADRVVGATETIRRLALPWVITLVSTHDFELCALERDPAVNAVNYHFREYYEDDQIRFDYRLLPGRCTTTNARALMRLVGIL